MTWINDLSVPMQPLASDNKTVNEVRDRYQEGGRSVLGDGACLHNRFSSAGSTFEAMSINGASCDVLDGQLEKLP